MAKRFNVSALTIRRDLEMFEKQGFVNRFYGGAKVIDGAIAEDPAKKSKKVLTGDDETETKERLRVAKLAATLVEDGDTIFINSSRTAIAMISCIHKKKVTVITNNGHALELPRDVGVTIVLTGGEATKGKCSLLGDVALSTIKKIKADKCFIGVSGVSTDGKISTAVLQETMINKLMIAQTKHEVVILADGSRIGKANNFVIGDVSKITHIVTDKRANKATLEQFQKDGVRVMV